MGGAGSWWNGAVPGQRHQRELGMLGGEDLVPGGVCTGTALGKFV